MTFRALLAARTGEKISTRVVEIQDQDLMSGKKLNVRGYIGVSMLGRSQTWERQE